MDASRERIRTCLEAFCFDFLDDLGEVGISYCRDILLGPALPDILRETRLSMELEFPMARQITLLFFLLQALFALLQSLVETLKNRAQRFKPKLTKAGLNLQ